MGCGAAAALGLPVGFGLVVCVGVPVGVGVGVGVGVTVGVVVGVGVVGGVVIVSDGTSLGAGAGWVGAGLAGDGTAAMVEGTADGTQTGSAKETFGVGTDDGDTGAGDSGTVAGWPAADVAAADAEGDEALEYEALGAGAAEPEFRSAPLASWEGVSWPKNGSSRACPKVPAVRTRPRAPATTAMRWLMCLTDAAFRRTAWGSRPSDDPPLPGLEGAGVADSFGTSLRLASEADAVAAAATCAGDEPRGETGAGETGAGETAVGAALA